MAEKLECWLHVTSKLAGRSFIFIYGEMEEKSAVES